jgi:uncharacterized protein DUF4157
MNASKPTVRPGVGKEGSAGLPSHVSRALSQPGRPLEAPVREALEPRFGHDFSAVRIHADRPAFESAQALGARAYTVGTSVVFNAGQYAPQTAPGRRLLAHELTHVVQQSGGGGTVQRQPLDGRRFEKNSAPPAQPESEDEAEPQEGEAAGELEAPEALADVEMAFEDQAPEEEAVEDEVSTTPIAAASMPGAPMETGTILPPDHPSEREAEAASRAITSPVGTKVPVISRLPGRPIQRQIFYDQQSALGWGDFKAKAPKKSPFDALTWSGMKPPKHKVTKEARPESPIFPDPCKLGKKSDVVHLAVVGYDLHNLDVRALMYPNKSWVKPNKQSAALLQHEQGHFDISNVIAEKAEWAMTLWAISHAGEATKCGKKAAVAAATKAWNKLKPNKAIAKIWKQASKVWKKAQGDYDGETGHGSKATEQATWNDQIAANLPNYELT